MRIRPVSALALAGGLFLLAGCGDSQTSQTTPAPAGGGPPTNPATTATTAAPGAVAPAPVAGGRTLTAEQREGMLQVLNTETGAEKKVWLVTNPGDPEAAAFRDQLIAAFKQAGWEVKSQTITGMLLKAGVSFMEADEQSPSYVETAKKALQAAGIQFAAEGTGYRAFYDEKKKENPGYPGLAMASDQSYAVIVGRKP